MPQKETKTERFIYWTIALILVFGGPYIFIFSFEQLSKYFPMDIVFMSVFYLIVGTFVIYILQSIFSKVDKRLTRLELYEGEKRFWKEIIIYYLIAFTAVAAYISKSVVQFLLVMLITGLLTQLAVFI